MSNWFTILSSPVGPLRIVVGESGRLSAIDFNARNAGRASARESPERCAHVVRQLEEYFAGTRTEFTLDVAFDGTEFQNTVWRELCRIPHGRTISYRELARRAGRPKAVRAVGQANGRNKVPIVVPCHRVIGADGDLTGFGGGLDIKRALLEHERGRQGVLPFG